MNNKHLFLFLLLVPAFSLFADPGMQVTLFASLHEANKIYEKELTLRYAQDGTPLKRASHEPYLLSLITDSGYEAIISITRVQPKMVTIKSEIQELSRIVDLFPMLAHLLPPTPIQHTQSKLANGHSTHIPIIPPHIDEDMNRMLSIKVAIASGIKSKL